MFSFFRQLFRSRPHRSETPLSETTPHSAPGTSIHYDPQLVPRLVQDHSRLEELFERLKQDYERRDVKTLQADLTRFSDVLRDHLLTENVRFYVYLQHVPEHAPVVQRFQREIRVIGRDLTRFLIEYGQRRAWDAASWQAFDQTLQKLGPILASRIATEERELYPLYQPPKG